MATLPSPSLGHTVHREEVRENSLGPLIVKPASADWTQPPAPLRYNSLRYNWGSTFGPQDNAPSSGKRFTSVMVRATRTF